MFTTRLILIFIEQNFSADINAVGNFDALKNKN